MSIFSNDFSCISLIRGYILSAAQLLQITSRKASASYLKMIDNSYLGNSDEVNLNTALVIYIDIKKL